jgi:hypothetical protein
MRIGSTAIRGIGRCAITRAVGWGIIGTPVEIIIVFVFY